jgi:O-antigen ligase
MQPVRISVIAFGVAGLASYTASALRPTYGVETRAGDRGVLMMLGLMGVALVAADGVATLDRLERLLRRIVLVSSIISVVGILQFATGFDLAGYVKLPGLSVNNQRIPFFPGSFRRVAGTAGHPIEFGVVLAMTLPLATWLVLDTPRRRQWRWRATLILISIAMPMSLSRSAFLGLTFGGLALLGGWSWKRRRQAMTLLGVYAVVMRFLVPGLLGTVKSLFLNLRSDPSFQGRTQDYSQIGDFIRERPIFGRGLGTFLPDIYVLLDNQYLGIIIEMGFVGLAALLLLFLSGIFCARGARRRSRDESSRQLGQALTASILIAMTGFITFDAMSFPMITGLLFLLLGCCGASWRLVQEQNSARASVPSERSARSPSLVLA